MLAPIGGFTATILVELIKQFFDRYNKRKQAFKEREDQVSQFLLEEKKLGQADIQFLVEQLRKDYERSEGENDELREIRNIHETQIRGLNGAVDVLDTAKKDLEITLKMANETIQDFRVENSELRRQLALREESQ